MTIDVYEKLRHYLDRYCPTGVPPAPSRVELKILEALFTPEEAQIVTRLTPFPEPISVLSTRLGIPRLDLRHKLHQMAEKCLIRAHPVGHDVHYSSMPFAPGIAELSIRRSHLDPDFARTWLQYLDEAFGQTFVKPGRTPIIRTLPIQESIDIQTSVVSYEREEDIIRRAPRPRCVTECWCRKTRQIAGASTCHRPMEVCIGFGAFARDYINSGVGREVNDEEFRQILKVAREAGLVHTIAVNTKSFADLLNICNCCTCCCSILRYMVQIYNADFGGGLARSTLVPRIDTQTCTGCGICIDSCPFAALFLDNGSPSIKEGRCMGCGLCAVTCPVGSIKLFSRKPEGVFDVPETFQDLLMRTMEERKADES